jgi:hypothetical protein
LAQELLPWYHYLYLKVFLEDVSGK